MSYIDKIYVLNHTNEIVEKCKQRSNLSHVRTTRIPHPQKRKSECLKITLIPSDTMDFSHDKVNLYIDDFEIIKVTNAQDKPIMESEQTCLKDEFYVNFLNSYLKKQYEIHGEKYIEDAKIVRQHNIDLFLIAKKHAENIKNNLLFSISASGDKNLDLYKIKKDINYYSDIINCMNDNITNQNNIINCLDSIQKSGQITSSERLS